MVSSIALAVGTLFKEIFALKEYALAFQLVLKSLLQCLAACASAIMLPITPILQFVVVLLPAAWSDIQGEISSIAGFLVSGSGYSGELLSPARTHPWNSLASLLSNVDRGACIVGACIVGIFISMNVIFLRYIIQENGSHPTDEAFTTPKP
eukprot:g10886.t1